MSEHDPNSSRRQRPGQRLPAWAGYLLIGLDTTRRSIFLVPWLGTLAALWLTLPTNSLWIALAVLGVATLATWAAVTRALAAQASQQGALGAYVARLANETAFGRWLVDWASSRGD